jgi:PAS domain S-box-containing protein
MGEPPATDATVHASYETYRILFEMESDAIFLIDNEAGQILEVNPAASTLYGYSRAELLSKRNVDLSAEPGDTRAATQGQRPRVPFRYQRKKDGTVFPVEITARHFVWRGRDAHIAAIRDITHRQRAEAALVRRTRQLETVRATTAEITRELDLPAVLRLITQRACVLTGATAGDLDVWDDARRSRRRPHGSAERPGRWTLGEGRWVVATAAGADHQRLPHQRGAPDAGQTNHHRCEPPLRQPTGDGVDHEREG